MASSSGPPESIEDFYAKLGLGDESEGGLEIWNTMKLLFKHKIMICDGVWLVSF